MKKTFRRVLASMLAVLMIVCSLPFTASAAELNRKWWVADGVDPATITEEPTFLGFNSDDQEAGSWGLPFGQAIDLYDDNGYEDHRDDWKPIIAVTVSSQGENGMNVNTLKTYAGKYYGADETRDYETVKNEGYLLNPAELKAGQRIAVSLEFGGIDVINNGQFLGNFDPEALKPAYYSAPPARKDTWSAVTGSSDKAVIATGAAYYGKAMAFAGANTNTETNVFYMAFMGVSPNNGSGDTSNFIGTGLNNTDGTRPFGKYGIYTCTYSFEVLKDCDLKDVFTFKETQLDDGTVIEPYSRNIITDGAIYITTNERPNTMAVAPVVWSEYSKGGSTECTHANLTKTDEVPATCLAAGTAAYWTCNDCGKMFSDASATTEIPAPVTLDKLNHSYTGAIKSNGDGTHSYLCVNGCNQYGGKVECTFGDMTVVNAPTITNEGTGRYTCGDCHYYYDVVLDKVTCTHEHTEIRDAEAETCTKEGYTGDTWCLDCGEKIATGSPIDKKAHTPGTATQEDVIDSTCQAEGSYNEVVRCTVCNEIISSTPKTIAKKAHTPGAAAQEDVIDSTCSAEGSYNEVVRCTVCNEIISSTPKTIAKKAHTPGAAAQENVVPAELDKDGSYDDVVRCTVCNEIISSKHQIIPALKGFTVKVDAVDLGTVTLNGEDVTAGAAKRVLAGSKVTLTATPVEGATFVGWVANGSTTVSTDTTFVATALADITYTPVFAIDKADEFTVTFVDSFGNVVSAQTVTSGSAIVVPAAPSRPGYSAATENGWSMTNDEIAALTASATITAQYVQDAEKTFTVTATGCDIVVNGVTTADTATDVAYDTLVTVTAADAKAWAINGVTVAYGDTYTFFVSSDVTLTKVVDAVTATPTIANVSKTTTGATGAVQAVFTATRSMTDDCTFVDAGFVYGKGDLGEITLDDVTGTTVKAAYVKTPVEQFSLVYGLRAQTGSITARAFLAYVDAEGNSQVIYADPQTFTY